ncbi:hypothetical protein E2C01_046859 [Portunus trituberculatus]|uniref:Uncharacterized protein n=1 Tax=Portunus trituberculatus TaxID=210409 RepID=A0A5B7G5V5_PORTR|nr:hypothetical protein [Portunus trituberculatus]
MVISRSLAVTQEVEGKVMFGSITLPLQEYIKILGVDLDRELRFDRHLKHVAHQALCLTQSSWITGQTLSPAAVQGPDKALPGVWGPDLDVQRCYTPATAG